jgi:hypothetical protein
VYIPSPHVESKGQGDQATNVKPGTPERIVTGMYIGYRGFNRLLKICGIGKTLNVSCREAKVVVHKQRPLSDHRLRLRQVPMFTDAQSNEEEIGSGARRAEETVDIN